MKSFIITFLSCIMFVNVCAQVPSPSQIRAAKDTLVFRQLHFDRVIAPTTDLKIFAKYYQALRQGYKGYEKYKQFSKIHRLNAAMRENQIYGGSDVYSPNSLRDMGEIEKKAPFFDPIFDELNKQYYERKPSQQLVREFLQDSVERWNWKLQDQMYEQHGRYSNDSTKVRSYHRRAEMRDLEKRLRIMRDSCENLPIFFVDIDHKFGGNIRKYVRHLYKNSLMGSSGKLFIFMRNPSAETIQNDPGVQYAVGLALYELWIKKVREGKVK